MGNYTDQERRTDPPEFEDEVWPEDDPDVKRKEEIETRITEELMDALRDIGRVK